MDHDDIWNLTTP